MAGVKGILIIVFLVLSTFSFLIFNTIMIPFAAAHKPNVSPTITSPADGEIFTFEAGQGISAQIPISATDPNGHFINIVNTPLPAGAFYEFVEQFQGDTGASLTFEDGRPFIGSYNVTFTAINEHGTASSPVTITIVVIAPDYLDIEDARLEVNSKNVMMEVSVKGSIKPTIERPPYGFAALTNDGTGILGITTHAGILDSEDQSDAGDDILHTHVVDVISSSDCTNGIKVVSASFESPSNLVVRSHEVRVTNAPSSSFGEFTGTVISFILTIEEGSVCVNPVDSFT